MAEDARTGAAQRRRMLGWGFECRLTPDGDLGRDLVLSPGPRGRDLTQVVDVDNLTQCLAITLTTLAGSDVFNVAFGFTGLAAIAEETSPAMIRERLRIAVVGVLQAEPRVRRVADVSLAGAYGEVSADPPVDAHQRRDGQPVPAATPRDLRQLSVRVEFETVSGDRQLIDVGKVVADV